MREHRRRPSAATRADRRADARITRAFLLVAGRAAESRRARRRPAVPRDQPARYPGLAGPDARRRAWTDFCQMLLASDAFLYVE